MAQLLGSVPAINGPHKLISCFKCDGIVEYEQHDMQITSFPVDHNIYQYVECPNLVCNLYKCFVPEWDNSVPLTDGA